MRPGPVSAGLFFLPEGKNASISDIFFI